MKKIRLIIMGFGKIGQGLATVLLQKRKFIEDAGYEIIIPAVCEYNGSIIEEQGINIEELLGMAKKRILNKHRNFTDKLAAEVLKEVDADIAVELTPGNVTTGEPGVSNIMNALENGKHVVTSNKAPLALKFTALTETAKKHNKMLLHEAAVAGAVPLFNLYHETLQINEIKRIYGIFNGTTNYILTKMTDEKVNFDSALKEAQELGYAESNPEYDINGYDTGMKVVIVANALMNKKVSLKDIKISGIKEITNESINLAKEHGYVIKLIGDVNELEVSPRLVQEKTSLNVGGNLNAVMFETDIAKDITIIGRGAGPIETSSSIISDILTICKQEYK